MTRDETAPVVPDVSIQVDDVGAADAVAVREGRHPRTPHGRAMGSAPLVRPRPDDNVVNVLGHG